MCGVAGICRAALQADDAQRTASAVEGMRHRGPDDSGFFADASCSLGHARLSIIDLSPAGRQPMASEDGQVQAVVNGEIYNFLDLRRALEGRGHVFRSHSDSEVIVHGYEEWGSSVFGRLHGMFALAVWDARERRLLLGRDPLGQKPLYYHLDSGGRCLMFASELPALLPCLDSRPPVSAYARDAYLTFGYVPDPHCIYDGIAKLSPGTWLSFRPMAQTWHTEAYWDPLSAATPRRAGTIDEDELADELQDLLGRAVGTHLVSDVPLGCFLSGGIDSTLITALAARQRPGLQTFSVAFDFAEFDESPHAEAIAAELGTDHTTVRCSSEQALDIIPNLPAIYGEPYSDPSAIPTVLLCREAKRNFTVALSGDAGDELFWGYNRYEHYRRYPVLERVPPTLRRAAAGILQSVPGSRKARALGRALAYRDFAEFALLFGGIFHRIKFPRLRGELFDLGGTVLPGVAERCRELKVPDLLCGPRLDLYSYLPGDILVKVDRASMLTALEVRVPLLDVQVIEWALSLPVAALVRTRDDRKRPLKRLLGRLVDERLWRRPKQGFGAPVGHWMRGPLRDMLHDLLSPARLQREGIFDLGFVRELIDDHEHGRKNNEYYLWTLLMWEMWRDAEPRELSDRR